MSHEFNIKISKEIEHMHLCHKAFILVSHLHVEPLKRMINNIRNVSGYEDVSTNFFYTLGLSMSLRKCFTKIGWQLDDTSPRKMFSQTNIQKNTKTAWYP